MYMRQNEHGFTIGEHEENGRKYKFRLSNRKYSILECVPDSDEKPKTLLVTPNSTKAYEEWNKIKRPEKMKK